MKKKKDKKKRQINTRIDYEIKSPLTKRIVFIAAIALLVFITIYPVLGLRDAKSTLKTQIAVKQTIYKTIDADAFAVRKESYINNSYSGTIVPAVTNGSKVAIGDTVANVFSGEKYAENFSRLLELKEEIDYYTGISIGSVGTLQTDIDVYKSSVNNSLFELSSVIDGNDLSSVYELSRELRESITKKQIVTGVKVNVSDILQQLTDEYNSLKKDAQPNSGVIAETPGYYVNTVDGYEDTVDFDSVKELSWDQVENIMNAPVSSIPVNNVGKIITDFNWYLVCNTTIGELETKSTGSYVTVIFGNSQVDQVRMRIEQINDIEGSDKVTLILSSNIMNEDIAELRKVSVKIRVDSLTGLSVDKMSLRTVDGEKGVYVKVGNLVDFKLVDIAYSDDNIVLVNEKTDTSYLSLYDEVILEGTDLYEAKLLD